RSAQPTAVNGMRAPSTVAVAGPPSCSQTWPALTWEEHSEDGTVLATSTDCTCTSNPLRGFQSARVVPAPVFASNEMTPLLAVNTPASDGWSVRPAIGVHGAGVGVVIARFHASSFFTEPARWVATALLSPSVASAATDSAPVPSFSRRFETVTPS